MKLDNKDYINILLFIAVLILMFIIVVKIGQEGAQCTLNPLEFGAEKLMGKNGYPVTCQCSLMTEGEWPIMFFDHNSTSFQT